jgi:hypothetical protein
VSLVAAHQEQTTSDDPLVTADESVRLQEVSLQAALREQLVLQPEEPPSVMQMEQPLQVA